MNADRREDAAIPNSDNQARPDGKITGKWCSLDSPCGAMLFLLLASLAAYSPVLVIPYLLTDETWIVRPQTWSWVLPMGRPIFAAFIWVTGEITKEIGLSVIYVMRLSAIVALSGAAYVLTKWLQEWGHGRLTSLFLSFAVITLPAYQIVIADGTQLAFALLFAVLAVYMAPRHRSQLNLWRVLMSLVLLLASLLIYQQQMLIVFAMLAVPLLNGPREKRTYLLVASYGAFAGIVPVVYFLIWRIFAIPHPRYGPSAVGLPSLAQIKTFLTDRLLQVANLWDISDAPRWNLVVAAVLFLVLLKAARDLWIFPRHFPLTYLLLLGLVPTTDGFAILARNFPSYITATALSLIVVYWAFSGLVAIFPKGSDLAAIALAIVGCVAAFVTVRDHIAVPNWREFDQIRTAILSNPDSVNFHLVPKPTAARPGYQEFQWRNRENYLYLMAVNVADDLALKGKIPKVRRGKMYISVEGQASISRPSEARPDSIFVQLLH